MAIDLFDGIRVKAASPLNLHSIVGTKDLNMFGTKPVYATKEAFAASPYSYSGATVYDVDTGKKWLYEWEWNGTEVVKSWKELPVNEVSSYDKYLFVVNVSNQNYDSQTKVLTINEFGGTFEVGDEVYIVVNGLVYNTSFTLNGGTNTLKWMLTDYDLGSGDVVEIILYKKV